MRPRGWWRERAWLLCVPLLLAGCRDGLAQGRDDPPDGGEDEPDPLVEPECDLQAVFAHPDNGCTNEGCHGTQHVAELDLLSDGLGERLVGKRSVSASCGDRLVIDPESPERSLLLTQLTPQGVEEGCGVIMPVGSQGVGAEDFACIEQWVEHLAATTEPGVEDDFCDEFEPSSVRAQVSKVKTLMTGRRATADEVEQVAGDPGALAELAWQWIETPEFQARLLPLLDDTLQISLDLADLDDKIAGLPELQPLVERDLGESLRRTALRIIDEDRPFTEIATTRQWEVTTFTLAVLAYLDASPDERKAKHDQVVQPPPGVPDPIPLAYSIANRIWQLPPASAQCDGQQRQGEAVLTMLLGRCRGSISTTPVFQPSDFEDWRTVELLPSAQAEPEPVFWDVPALRAVSTQMEVGMPRVGFSTHPAFMSRWETNADNQFRVTTNQALLVATGHTFEVSDATEAVSDEGLAAEHAEPGTACHQCHRLLDPMRVYYLDAYDFDLTGLGAHGSTTAAFAFRGQTHLGGDLYDFAEQLGSHPDFAIAWAGKLCSWANSQACDPDDPELLRVAQVFVDSGYSFRTLVVELLTSRLVTGASLTQTQCSRPFLVSITRRDQLCHALEARLGVQAPCDDAKVAKLAELVPEDSIARGDPAPVLDPMSSAFHAAGVEQLCAELARQHVVEGGAVPPGDRPAALAVIVEGLMSLDVGTPRYTEAMDVLEAHLDEAAATASELDAMRSTFTLGCLSADLQALGL